MIFVRWGGEQGFVTYDLYADVIFFNNLVMDFLLLTIVERIMRLKKRRWGKAAASILGALYALAVTVFPLNSHILQAAATYLLVSALMVWTAFPVKTARDLARTASGLYMAAAVTAGLFGLFHISGGPSWYLEQLLFHRQFLKLPFFIYVILAAGSFFMACYLWEAVKKEEKKNEHYVPVILFYQGRTKELTAFIDTGNRLEDPYSHKPVSVISADCCRELFETVSAVTYIPFRSVGKENGLLPAVKADRMELIKDGETRIIDRPILAISKDALSPDGAYQMLLHENMWL